VVWRTERSLWAVALPGGPVSSACPRHQRRPRVGTAVDGRDGLGRFGGQAHAAQDFFDGRLGLDQGDEAQAAAARVTLEHVDAPGPAQQLGPRDIAGAARGFGRVSVVGGELCGRGLRGHHLAAELAMRREHAEVTGDVAGAWQGARWPPAGR
jgi:hypothetical protein